MINDPESIKTDIEQRAYFWSGDDGKLDAGGKPRMVGYILALWDRGLLSLNDRRAICNRYGISDEDMS